MSRHGIPPGRPYPYDITPRTVDPDFVPSLQLLIEEQQYSLTDVALMFGVSRERVRQWCERYDVIHRKHRAYNARNSQRIWNDERNRFEPTFRRTIKRRTIDRRKRDRLDDRIARRAGIILAIRRLRSDLGREPTWREMWIAVGGDPSTPYFAAAPRLLSYWGLVNPTAPGAVARAARELREATGVKARPLGYRGHLNPRGRRHADPR